MLSSSGLTNVKCKRLVPKSDQTFYTAAFRVACDLGLGLPPFEKKCGTVREVGGFDCLGERIREGVPMLEIF